MARVIEGLVRCVGYFRSSNFLSQPCPSLLIDSLSIEMAGKYLIRNATVITVDEELGVIPNGDVLIEDGIIAAVGPSIESRLKDGVTIIDGTNAIVSPGFIDTHRHTWQTQLRTVCTDHVLSDYVISIRNTYGSCYDARDAYLGNLCGALESIDNGITFLVDHSHIMNSPDHADGAVKGLKDSGIRAVFCYGLYDNPYYEGCAVDPSLNAQNLDWRLEDAKRIKQKYFESNNPTDRVRFGFAPTEIERTSLERSIFEVEYARSLNAATITGHVGLGKYDRQQRFVQSFADKNLLGPDLLFSHCTALTDGELAAIKKSGTGLSSTPDTEMQMCMGHPIAFKAKKHGCSASIGVDVCSNIPADMFQQMRLLLQAERHKQNEASNGPLPAVAQRCEEVLRMATMGGAEAVGLQDLIGSITPGKRADLILIRCDSTRLTPIIDPIGALVLYANGSDIDTVFVDGVVVKNKYALTVVDWPKVRDELRESHNRIMTRAKNAPTAKIQERVMGIMAGTSMNPEEMKPVIE